MDFLKKRIGRRYELDSSGLANIPVVGCCEYGNDVWSYIKFGEYFEWPDSYQFDKMSSYSSACSGKKQRLVFHIPSSRKVTDRGWLTARQKSWENV